MMEGRTTFLCTHNLAEAEALCESVIILRAGEVILHEKIATLRRRFPRSVYLASRQRVDDLAGKLVAMGKTARIDGAGAWVGVTEPEQEVPELLRSLLSSGFDVYESHVTEPSLEEMFLDLIEEAAQ